jgi:D-alanyl-lipoteichoic acid acyltransferase DltB (MBOAT superfamily)
MDVASLTFVGFVALVVVAFHACPWPSYRLAVVSLANVVFIASYLTEFRQVLPLLSFLVLGYGMIELVRIRASGRALAFGLCSVLVVYVLLKRFSFLDGLLTLPFPYLIVGLSYILFRILHLMIDARDGGLAAPIGPLAFFNYTCGFLSFVAGPIERYQDFIVSSDRAGDRLDADRVRRAFARMIGGYAKVIILSGIADHLFLQFDDRLLTSAGSPGAWRFVIDYCACAMAYTVYLYYNFSGYMDIVIGAGWLLGRELPENFNKPFLARNFLEFWSRWHMTLSDWFRTYLFNPIVKTLAERLPAPALLPYIGVVAFFATFFVMGVWHGTTSVFMIYGLVMGAGASVNKLWQVMLIDRLGRKGYRALSEQPLYLYGCRGLTVAYFAVGLTGLWVDMGALEHLWVGLGPLGLVAALALIALAAGAVLALQDAVLASGRRWLAHAAALSRASLSANLWAATQILAILVVASFFHKTPEFVYRAF